jgi:hypothetical protein
MTDGLPEWLREQLDEDAREADGCHCSARERVLAEIAAKRALIDEYTQAEESLDHWACPDMVDVGRAEGLRAGVAYAALPYTARPGYDEAWRP